MLDIHGYIERLKELGYSQAEANDIVSLHIGTGTLDILDSSIERCVNHGQENGRSS